MKITGCEVRTIGWIIKHLSAELLQEMCWPSNRLWPSVIVQQDNTGIKASCAACLQKLFRRSHLTVDGRWNKSLQFQPLQQCYCENSGSPASVCVMRRHYSITYTQSLHAINGLLAVGRVGNLLCGHPSSIFTIIKSKLKICEVTWKLSFMAGFWNVRYDFHKFM